MFRYRDSALKALNQANEEFSECKFKIVSTSETLEREAKVKLKEKINDPIQRIKAEMHIKYSAIGKQSMERMSLEELEAVVIN